MTVANHNMFYFYITRIVFHIFHGRFSVQKSSFLLSESTIVWISILYITNSFFFCYFPFVFAIKITRVYLRSRYKFTLVFGYIGRMSTFNTKMFLTDSINMCVCVCVCSCVYCVCVLCVSVCVCMCVYVRECECVW